ncbi:unnamed protein product [Phaedon cochleariae]|uniref:Uncharacterized protein n=1 Tax=Phaedon cochleariae TaxID=80249 RepID=A0A9P0DSY3_PHACE|nr:unnamed protein product [Phaedon cochleariae]
MEQARSSGNEGQSSFILNKKPIPEVTLIVHEQSLDKSVLVRIVQECHTPYFYHKFIIGNIGNYSKKYILKTISNFVYPASFRALHFTISKNKAVFLSRNCQELLLKICSEKFRIANPECPETPFKVIILANFILYEEVEVEDNSQSIIDAITKRFNSETETMDLNEFSEDEDLIDYYPLFQIKILLAVTSKVAEFLPKHLNLQKNCIRDISNLHPLKDFIESIDLCNNMIEDISALMPLINFKTLKHLSLSGNPFCEKYYNYNYVLDVKRYCQSLEKLDGFDITTPVFQKNLFCSDDAMDLAKNFLEHYFTIYDSGNRQNLIDIYAKDALFSVTAKIVPNQRNSSSTKLEHYGLRIPFTIYGATEIVKLFKTFPKTYHDPYPSVCDVTLLTDTHASLVVGGIFKELQQLLSFTRHFIFKRSGNTFHIINEQLHVSNALDFQTGWSFGFPMHLAYSGNPLPYFQEQYRQLEETVHEITTMNYEYSQKYLDYCQYDLKKTLDLFSTLHVRGDVPENAFTPESAASKQLQKSVPPYPERIRKMAYKKHKSINLKTIWEILQSERTRDASDSPPTTDPTIQKIYRNVIIPTIGDGFSAPTKSLLPLQAPIEDKNISQKAPIKPISFNIPAVANPAKIKPTQMVKPATKANVDPLVELAEKMAKYKEIAAKKAAELSKIPLPSSGPSRVNQTAASVPSMVPPPPSIVPATAQLSQIPGAAIHSNLLNPVPAPLFTPATTMEQHLVPSHRLPPPLMPAQYQMHSNFPMQYQVPMQHQLPVPYNPNTHVLVPQDSVQGRPNLQSVPRAVFPISGNVQPNYQNAFQTPNPTMVPNVPRPSGLPMVPNLGGMVPQPGFPVPRFPVVQSPVVPQLNQPRVSVPTAFSMVPSPVVSRPRVTVPRPTLLLDQTLVTKPVSSSQVASNVQPSGIPGHIEIGEKNKTDKESGRYLTGKLESRWEEGRRFSRSKSRSRSRSRNRRSRSRDRYRRSRSHSRNRRSRSRSKDRSKRSNSLSRDRTKRSNSRNRFRRSRSRSKDRSKRSNSRSRDRSKRSNSRSRNRRSRSRSKDRSKRGNSCSRDRSKRSNSRNRNRRSRSRSKKRSNSRSRDTSKRSSSLSRNRRSRSRSKDRSKRGNSCSKDRRKRSNSRGRNVSKRSRSRSRDRSKRSRSRSIDKSRRSRSRSRNAKSRRNDSKAATIISPAEPENANEVSGVKSKVTTVGSTPRNRSQDAKRKSPGSEKRNESTVSSKIVVTSNISSPRVTIASKIAKIKEVLGKISDIQETRQEQAANEAASKKNTGKVIVDNKNKKGGAKMTKDSNQGFKSKWDKGPQPETTGSGSLIIERSASGAVVKISTAKNAPGSGPPVSFNSGTPDTVDTGDDETAMLALALLERKRQLDFEIQRGFEKIKELEKLRSSTNPKDTSKDDIANEVCSTKEDASVQEKVTAEENTPIKSVDENSDEITVKDIERPEESPANKGEVDVVPPSDNSNKIEDCVSAKSEGTSDVGEKLDQGKSSVDNSNRSNDESNEKGNDIAPKTAIGETNVNIEKIGVTVKDSTKHIIEADVIKPPNQDELKPTEILLVETELKLDSIPVENTSEKEIKSPNESVAKIKPMEKESVKHEDSLMKPTNQNESKPLDVLMTKTHLVDNSDAETCSSILTPKSEDVPKVEGKIMLGKPHSDESNAKSGDISSKRVVEETNIVTEKKSMVQLDKHKLSEMSIIKEELKLENVSVKSTCENLLQSTDNVTLKSETIELTEKESIKHEQKVMKPTNQNESLKVPIIKTDLADNSNAETSSTFLKPKSDGIPKVDEKSMIKIPNSDDSTEKESTELEISIPSTNKRVKLEKLQKTEEVKHEENWVKPTNQPETMTVSADNPNTETSNIMVEIPKSKDELPEKEKNASTETTVEETNANRKIDGSRNECIKQDVVVTVTPTDIEKSQSNNIVEIPELNEISKDTEVDTKIMAENIPVGNKPPNTKELISSTDKDEHGKTDSKKVTISIENKPTEEETTTKTKIQESDQQKVPVEAPGIKEIDSKNALSVSEKVTDSSETTPDEVSIEEHNVVTSSIGQSSIEVVQTSEIREDQGQKTDDPIKVTTKSTGKEETSIEDTPSITKSHDGVDNTDESSKTVNTSKSHGPVAIIMDKTENLETPSRENIATVTDTDEFPKENISLESIKSADVDKPDMEDDLFRCPKQAIEANIIPKPTDTDEIIRETTSEVQPCDNNEDNVTENILAQVSNEEDKKTEDMKEEKSLDKEATKDQLGEVVTSRSSRKKSADESTYAFRCPNQAIEANITPKPTDTDEIIRETTSEVQPCDNDEDNVTENSLAQSSNEEDKKTEDMKDEKSLDEEATKDQLDEVVTSRSSRKKSADESTYAIEKIVQLAGISNPEPILAAAMDIPITNDVEIDDTTKVIEKITETSTNTVNEQLMDNLNSSSKINKKIVDETTNESKKMPDERQHVDSTELKTTTSDTSAEDMEQDSESKKLAADYSKKLIVLLKNVASDPRTAEKRIPHETLGTKEAQVHQPKPPTSIQKSLEENNDSDNEKAFINKNEPAQFQESSEEPIFIPKKIPLVLVDSSDEESNKTDEEVEEEETFPITEGLTVIDEIQSNDNDENVTTTREVVKTIRIDSPILLTISSDEEDNTSQDKIIFIDEDSDQEIEYVGLKDIL